MREGMRERDRGGSPDASAPPPFRGPAYKTKLCALWRGRGGCPRPNCGFAHGEAELRRPPPRGSFQPRPRPGRRDYRDHEFRLRPERRHSPHGRYSPERDMRRRSLRDKRPSSEDRGSSRSRSPIRKSERKHSKSPDGGKTDSSISFSSDNEDRGKDERYLSSDEKNGREEKLKQMQMDMEALREDKSKLEAILEKKTDEERKLCSRVEDLELQLNREKEDCQRMTSKTKRLIKAHGRYIKAQEDLKRSQARFERLADLLASDILKPTKEQVSIGITANEDPYNANEMSPSDQRQNHVSASRKRPISLPTSEDTKTGKKQRENGDDVIPTSENYRPEDALEHVQDSKGTDLPESFTMKKLREGVFDDVGNIVSSSNIFADRYKGDDEEVDVD